MPPSPKPPLRSREIHKRLILAATVAVTFAAAARVYDTAPVKLLILWLSPIAGAILFDVLTRGRVHVVWVISGIVFAVAFLRIFVTNSNAWLASGGPCWRSAL